MADPERLRKFVSGERLKEYQTLAREKRDVTNGYNQVMLQLKLFLIMDAIYTCI